MVSKRPKGSKQQGTSAEVECYHPLPTCEGPKLDKFEYCGAAINFIRLLSAEAEGLDGKMFEVEIKAKHYALKMVIDI